MNTFPIASQMLIPVGRKGKRPVSTQSSLCMCSWTGTALTEEAHAGEVSVAKSINARRSAISIGIEWRDIMAYVLSFLKIERFDLILRENDCGGERQRRKVFGGKRGKKWSESWSVRRSLLWYLIASIRAS